MSVQQAGQHMEAFGNERLQCHVSVVPAHACQLLRLPCPATVLVAGQRLTELLLLLVQQRRSRCCL